jgi:hypothetical protein
VRLVSTALGLLVLQVATALASSYYVSPSGNDANAGTRTAPWRTLNRADNTVGSGDSLFCRGGTYTTSGDFFLLRSGTDDFALTNYAGEVPVFQTAGGGGSEPFVIGITGGSPRNIVIQGIQIRPLASMSGSSCIRIVGATNVTLRNLVVEGQKRTATLYTWNWIVNASGTTNLQVTGCNLRGCGELDTYGSSGWTVLLQQDCSYGYVYENLLGKGAHSVVAIYSGSHHNVIRSNTITQAIGYGVDTGAGTFDNLVEFNSCQGSDEELDYVKSPILVNGDRNIVRFNIGWDSEKHAIANAGGFNSRIYNNVFYGNGSDGFLGSALSGNPDSWGGNRLVNNVVTENMQTAPPNAYYAEACFFESWLQRNDGFQRNYLVLHGQTDDPKATFIEDVGFSRVSSLQSSYPNWRGNVYTPCNLGFVDAAAGDFRISPGSCLANAGEALTTTRSASSGTLLPVQDSYPFWVGDEVVFGSPRQLRRVTGVNHATRTLTLSTTATWGSGAPVSLPFSGTAPDIGCFELTAVQSLTAARVQTGVQVAWRFYSAEFGGITQVRVQRADDRSGPFATVHAQPLQPMISMTFTDVGAQANRTYWYRLLLDTQQGAEISFVVKSGVQATPVDVGGPGPDRGGRSRIVAIRSSVSAPAIEIHYAIASPSTVWLRVYDISGRRIRELAQGSRVPGLYTVHWDALDARARRVPSGVYLVVLVAPEIRDSKKILVVR